MVEWLVANMVMVWIIIAVVFIIIEGIVSGLVTIWFTIGGGVAAALAAGGAPIPVQVIVFFVVSLVLLIFTRPILSKKLKVGREKNYTEQLEGKPGLVVEPIEPFKSGQVKVGGILWTSVGETEHFAAPADSMVEIVRVEGVKLIVKEFTGAKEEGEKDNGA